VGLNGNDLKNKFPGKTRKIWNQKRSSKENTSIEKLKRGRGTLSKNDEVKNTIKSSIRPLGGVKEEEGWVKLIAKGPIRRKFVKR